MVRRAALRVGVFAVPNHRSMHNGKIPKLGGAAMFLSLVGAAFLCGFFSRPAAFLQLRRPVSCWALRSDDPWIV
jgi:UDP-N-acetylmuramyl pentapeptide phosphotransferase/UDP-N-acetylglucosamine-1-phosphate transferase